MRRATKVAKKAAKAAATTPPVAVERSRRAISPIRVIVSMLLVGVLTVGGYFGFQAWSSAQASEAYTPWFAGYTDNHGHPRDELRGPRQRRRS